MLFKTGVFRVSYSRFCGILWVVCLPLLCIAKGSSQFTVYNSQFTVDQPTEVADSSEVKPSQADEVPLVTQLLQIGYLSYDSALRVMPDYALVRARLDGLHLAYEAELKRAEDEFNQKYEDFLEGQRDFPRTILLKRQTELQQLLEHNLEFKRQGLKELQQAEEEALVPLRQKLDKAIATVARRKGLVLVVNTDSQACPYIDPDMGVNLQEAVAALLAR